MELSDSDSEEEEGLGLGVGKLAKGFISPETPDAQFYPFGLEASIMSMDVGASTVMSTSIVETEVRYGLNVHVAYDYCICYVLIIFAT